MEGLAGGSLLAEPRYHTHIRIAHGRTVARIAVVTCALLALAIEATPSEPRPAIAFRRVAIPDDVPAHLVSALAEDTNGFLWIGTQGGLVRYDGYAFKVFSHDASNPESLAGSYVRAIRVSRDGTVWVGTFSGGLSALDPTTGTFRRYQHHPGNAATLSSDRVEGIVEAADGRIWVATSAGLDRVDPKRGVVERFRHDAADPRSVADDQVRGLLVDRAGSLWVGTRDGLQRRLADDSGFERVASDPNVPGSLAGEFVSKLVEDRRGRIWIGTAESGAALFDPSTGTLRRFRPRTLAPGGLSHFWVYGIAEVAPREIWIATFGGGVDVIDAESLEVVDRLRNDPALENTIGGDRVGAILRDRAGVVWIGSWGQGLARHDPASRSIRTVRHSPALPNGLSQPSIVRAMEMDDGTVWAGTNGNGIDILDGDFQRIGAHRPRPADASALADGRLRVLRGARTERRGWRRSMARCTGSPAGRIASNESRRVTDFPAGRSAP